MKSSSQLLYQQAMAYYRQGRRPQAIQSYRRLLEAEPGFADGWYDLAYLLKQQGKHDEAIAAYQQALRHGVREPEEVHLNCAVIYSDHLRQGQDAEQSLRDALALNPNYAPAHLNLGNLFEERGLREEAVGSYEAILSAPERVEDHLQLEALARLSQLRPPQGPHDPILIRLRTVAAAATGSEPQTQANLYFALGRALDSLQLYDEAFAAFAKANQAAAKVGPAYSAKAAQAQFDAVIASSAPITDSQPVAAQTLEPLFVCGMFRSGSTLIEQVISGHAAISGGGELDHFPRLASSLRGELSAAQAQSWSQEYLSHLKRISNDEKQLRYVTDKRPDNFALIGLIKQVFPRAKIIHTIRHPLDNGLSLYVQHLDQRVAPHASDLTAIGHYYGLYRRLMEHWVSCYGADIHHFDYDAFVSDPQPQLDRLFEFLDLPNDPNCLQFHQRRNTVKTASYWQVRRPLYRDASGRWRNYQSHLNPLRDALRAAGITDLA